MFSRRSIPLLVASAALLTVSGFFAGKWVQDFRMAGEARGGDGWNQAPVRPIADVATTGRIVGGFDHQAALLLGVNGLMRVDPDALVRIVAAIHDRIKII